MASGDTKTEALLNILGHGGTGDEYRGSGNTKTQNYILDAIDRINNLDPGGGGSNFTVLTDADANYTDPDSGTECIALWLLPTGKYTLAQDATVELIYGYLDASDGGFPVGMIGASEQPIVLISHSESESVFTVTTIDNNATYSVYSETGIISSYYPYRQETFEGTDGETDGGDGLVPAPTTDDVDKFLKSDGTWDTVAVPTAVTDALSALEDRVSALEGN